MTGSPALPFTLRLKVAPGDSDGFERWRWGVSPLFAMDARAPIARSSFGLDALSYHFADVSLSSSRSAATAFDRDAPVVARAGLDGFLVMTYLSGGFALRAGGQAVEVGPGDVCVLDLCRTCRLDAVPYTSLALIMPRALLADLVPDADALHGLVLPRGSPLNGLIVAHLKTLLAEAPGLGLAEGHAAARGTAGLVAACLEPSSALREPAAEAVGMAVLQTMRRTIEDHLADPDLGPAFLLRRFAVSRATLYRLFEPLGGVRSFIQQRRLARVYQALTDPANRAERTGVIARCHGFTNAAAFSRAFRAAYGMAPGDIRSVSAAGMRAAEAGTFSTLHRWLLGIEPGGR